MKRPAAFTLVEMLVVLGILALLMGMLMPILMIAQRAARKSATMSVMHKTDTALRLFKNDMGVYPYQRNYADIDAGEAWTNRLAYHLGTEIALTDIQKLQADAAAVAAKYTYDCTGAGGTTENAPVSVHAFRKSDIHPTWQWNGGMNTWVVNGPGDTSKMAQAVILNRMAQERARLAVFSGNPEVTGLRIADARTPLGALYAAGRDNSATKILTTNQSGTKPGWADDYLKGELEKRFRDGDAILDAYRRPLIYICQITEGTRHVRSYIFHSGIYSLDVRLYGLQRSGRKVLSATDPLTGVDLVADPPALPDPANLRRSDRRLYAAPGYEAEYELWSAGPDRQFGWMRDDRRNQDNLPLIQYDKALP